MTDFEDPTPFLRALEERNAQEQLDTFLKELCDQHGWSYPGPRPLVERLFNSIAIRDATIVELRGELQRFHDDLQRALGDSYAPGHDVVDTVQRLREKLDGEAPRQRAERERRWADAMAAWRSSDKATRHAGYRAGARLAFNAGAEFRETIGRILKKYL